MFTNQFFSILFVLMTVLFSVRPAHAYLDPGTGSMILQGVLAAIAAAAVVTKLYWYRISRFFGFSKKNPDIENEVKNDKTK